MHTGVEPSKQFVGKKLGAKHGECAPSTSASRFDALRSLAATVARAAWTTALAASRLRSASAAAAADALRSCCRHFSSSSIRARCSSEAAAAAVSLSRSSCSCFTCTHAWSA